MAGCKKMRAEVRKKGEGKRREKKRKKEEKMGIKMCFFVVIFQMYKENCI